MRGPPQYINVFKFSIERGGAHASDVNGSSQHQKFPARQIHILEQDPRWKQSPRHNREHRRQYRFHRRLPSADSPRSPPRQSKSWRHWKGNNTNLAQQGTEVDIVGTHPTTRQEAATTRRGGVPEPRETHHRPRGEKRNHERDRATGTSAFGPCDSLYLSPSRVPLPAAAPPSSAGPPRSASPRPPRARPRAAQPCTPSSEL